MTPQEREMIAGLFARLQQFENQPRDRDADALIADLVRRQPSAPYLLTQAVLVQEEALKQAKARIAELEGGGGNFLQSGPWGAKSRVPQTATPQMAPAAAPMGGGGFLRSALSTAAGIAGGMLLFEGLRGMFGHHDSPWGQNQAQAAPFLGPGDSPADLAGDDGAADDYNLTDDSSGFDDGGGGGGDDFI